LRLSEPFELRERAQALQLAASIEAARHRPGAPSIPDDLMPDYARAIEALPGAVMACAAEPWDAEVAQVLAAALLVGKRQPALGARLLELGGDPAP
jgi:hypothetical protein